MRNFLIGTSLALIIGSMIALGQQTLPPSVIQLKGATDGTKIGNVGDSLKVTGTFAAPSPPANQNVTVTNASPVPVNGSVSISNFPAASPYPTPYSGPFPTPYPLQDVQINSTLVPFPTPIPPYSGPFPTPYPLQDINISSTSVPFPTPYSGPFPTPYPVQVVAVPSPVTVVQASPFPTPYSGPFPTPLPVQPVSIASPVPVVQSSPPFIVAGQAAVGATPAYNPVPISGVDGGGLKRAFLTDTSGRPQCSVNDASGNVWGPVVTLSGTNYQPVVLAASGTTGSSVPVRTIQIGGSDGTNLRSLSTDTNGLQNVNIRPDSTIQTYSACYTGLAVPAAPTDLFFITGSATKTVTVLSDQISGTETTVLMHLFQHIIRTTADSGGSCAGASIAMHDQNNSTATAGVQGCTTSPTGLGTSAGIVQADAFVIPATTGVDSSWPQIRDFAKPGQGQGIVLRGTSQGLYVNVSATFTTGTLNWCVTWTEQ